MTLFEALLIDIGRVGVALIFLICVIIDIKMRPVVFNMMEQKNVPAPWLFYLGAMSWKTLTSIALILNVFTFWAALLLALYIFLANLVFNNFWAVPKEKREFSFILFTMYLSICFGLLAIAGASGIGLT